MIEGNEQLNDLERLERSEFILDTEEHQRHQREEEEKISSLKEDIELANLAKMYLHNLIKKQCWNEMKVKGKAIKVCTIVHVHVHAFFAKNCSRVCPNFLHF